MSGVRGARLAALVVVAISVPAALLAFLLPTGTGFALSMLPFALVGALLMVRVPGNRIGWTMAAVGFLVCTGSPSAELAASVASSGRPVRWPVVALAWFGEWYWVPFLFLSLVILPLLFPSGRPASPRARTVLQIAVASCVVLTPLAVFQRDLLTEELARPLPNPLGVLPYGDVDLTPLVLVIVVSVAAQSATAVVTLLRRFRRAPRVEQQQLKAIVFGVLINVGGFVLFGMLDGLLGLPAWTWTEALLLTALPVSVLVAVTRYRLYEIDRLISRTVGYALVSAVLVGVYALIAIVPSALLDVESDLLVAAATLAAAGAFVPARRRIQATVDRHFNRARYDAQRVVDGFGDRLRHDLDLDGLAADVRAVVATTVQPAHVSLWIPGGGADR